MPWRIYRAYSIQRKDKSRVLRKRFVQCTVRSSSSFHKMCKSELLLFIFTQLQTGFVRILKTFEYLVSFFKALKVLEF